MYQEDVSGLIKPGEVGKIFISYVAGGYNSTGLSVSLVLNHRSFIRDWKPVVRITRVLMFDVLSNESLENPEEVLTC
jgi:hypothetical protein